MSRLALAMLALATCACAKAGLLADVGDTGLRTLVHDGISLLAEGRGREVRPFNRTPRIARPDGSVFVPEEKARVSSPKPWVVVQEYSWGVVECAYSVSGDRLGARLRVTNKSSTDVIEALELHVVELAFPSVPLGRGPDAGMFGIGGKWRALNEAPLASEPSQMPPVVFVRYEGGSLAFAADDDRGAVVAKPGIPFTSTPATKLGYPLTATFGSIAPGKTVAADVSVRFGGPEAEDGELAADVFDRFRERYPYALSWPDRRPIGALFLATSQAHPEKNPRGWFINAADVDVTTPAGIAKWRERLMKYADTAIQVLGDIHAQGMITWDPEGQQFPSAAFYGDPRLASTLAPETDARAKGTLGALDEYFRKFRDAGFATGITIRPQAIEFVNGIPAQRAAADPRAELLEKIAYARERWGCTIFYVDSSYDAAGALDAELFREIMERHPGILLLPENEVFRHFAYTAPLNSFHHHGVTSTPAPVRKVYPGSFSVIMSTGDADKMKAGREALLESVRRGDVLLVNAWYSGRHTEFVKGIYREAAAPTGESPDDRR